MTQKGGNFFTDSQKREMAMSSDSILSVFGAPCRVSRDEHCKYNCKDRCRFNLGSPSDAFVVIQCLRERIWLDWKNTNNKTTIERTGRDFRRLIITNELFRMKEGNSIRFYLGPNNTEVCKDFYNKALGIPSKPFDDILDCVFNFQNINEGDFKNFTRNLQNGTAEYVIGASNYLPKCPLNIVGKYECRNSKEIQSTRSEEVRTYLESYFSNGNFDKAPDKEGIIYCREDWKDIHKSYEDTCKTIGIVPVRYEKFCSIRSKECKNYQKHPCTSRSGWDHLVCSNCSDNKRQLEQLTRSFSHELDAEERFKLQKQIKDVENIYNLHLRRAEESRMRYKHRRYKVRRPDCVAKGYISMIVDAAGAQASNYCPRYATTEKNEPARHTMLGIKSTYIKVHGIGSLLLTTFPDLETQGGNLTVECIIRGVRFALKHTGRKDIDTLYVQLDNVSSNKCETVIVAMGVLVSLGICGKIKLNYLEVGHTHEDIDALIGTVVTKLRKENIPTFSMREQAIFSAMRETTEGKVKAVEQVVGITDYEAMFGKAIGIIKGIKDVKEFRITADADGKPEFVYKSNSTAEGWYPRPFEDLLDPYEIKKVFHHPDVAKQGFAMKAESVEAGREKGKKQNWYYKIKFAGGGVITFPMACLSVKINIPDAATLKEQVNSSQRQSYRGPLTDPERLEQIENNIQTLLQKRGDQHYIPEWTTYFNELRHKIESGVHMPVLARIVEDYGKVAQVRVETPMNTILTAEDLVAPLIVRGGSIRNQKHREQLLKERAEELNLQRLLKPSRKNAKTVGVQEGKGKRKDMEHEGHKVTGTKNKRRKTKPSEFDEEFDEEGMKCSEDCEMDEGEDSEFFTLNQFKYLENTMHYDPDDNAAYLVCSVEEEDFDGDLQIVVYRRMMQPNGSFGPILIGDPIKARDVESDHRDPSNVETLKKILEDTNNNNSKKAKKKK